MLRSGEIFNGAVKSGADFASNSLFRKKRIFLQISSTHIVLINILSGCALMKCFVHAGFFFLVLAVVVGGYSLLGSVQQGSTDHLNTLIQLMGVALLGALVVIWTLTTLFLNYFAAKEIKNSARLKQKVFKLQRAQEEMKLLVTAINQADETVVITDLDGAIRYVNPAFEKITGYSSKEAIGKHPRFLSSGKQNRTFYKMMWNTLSQGDVWRGHFINRRKDGSLFEESATISPVRNREGETTNYVAVKRDVTRKKLLEKQLCQAMKMEAIGALAGGIAHDFNNILAGMIGYSELVRLKMPAADPRRKDMDQVILAGHRAANLIKQILTFSRQGEERLQPVVIQPILKEVVKLLRATLPATIQLKEGIVAKSGQVLADPTQIHQIVMNLCINAKHAMGNKVGTLGVILSERHVAAQSVAGCPQLTDGTWLDLEISDTGCGMDKETRSKIFDPFFTTKETGKGTGLGLSVVHGIVKQCKGEITVASEPEQGTTFHIYLPVVAETKAFAKELISDEVPRGKGERILFVDDETVITTLTQIQLSDLGYRVSTFTSPMAALDAYQKNPNDFDLLITDMTMPKMTGTTLAEKVLAIRPDFPIILCTGFSEEVNEENIEIFGIREYISKPAGRYCLATAIRKALTPS